VETGIEPIETATLTPEHASEEKQ